LPTPTPLLVYRVGYVEEHALESLLAGLRSAYKSHKAVYVGDIEPPVTAYNWRRRQYDSTTLLHTLLKKTSPHAPTLFVAGVDAYADNLNFVFGEALLGQGAAIVYTPRLKPEFYGDEPNPLLYIERLIKESLHELGHAFGLRHCPTPGCVMNFSNSILEVDEKKPAYCQRCAEILAENGVLVNEEYILA